MTGEPVLALRRVTKRFGSVTAVDDVDLEVARGEFLTLLGPSGSGKSTILMMVAGFEAPSAGEIWLDGQPQSGVPPYKRRIGIVFQSYALFPHLTVFENVAFALRNLRWPRAKIEERVAELLQLVRLDGTDARLPSQLSGGQQQRVALARALAFRPSLLLLDEPLGALDKKLREHMLAEFQRIHQTLGTTMLFVTHDQEEALAMSDRIAVMEHGRIVQVDRPQRIYEDPARHSVADFVGDANLLAGTVTDAGSIRLDCGWDVACVHTESLGTSVLLLLRPEKLAIGSGPNEVVGRIVQRLYLGQTTKYVVHTGAGVLLQARVLNHGAGAGPDLGDEIILSWSPESGRVLRQEA